MLAHGLELNGEHSGNELVWLSWEAVHFARQSKISVRRRIPA